MATVARAVDGVSFTLRRGETLAIVGEVRQRQVGHVAVDHAPGADPAGRDRRRQRAVPRPRPAAPVRSAAMRRIRGNEIGMIFQEPMSSLNPLLTVGEQIAEVVRLHRGLGRAAARRHAIEMLARVNIPDPERRARRVSASPVRRHAPARDDRHGAGLPSGAADRRRTDHGAGRNDPGADPGSDPRACRRRWA